MTKRIVISIALIVGLNTAMKAIIITVKQDGTGNYTTIQAGINAATWNNGDTILVWPGVYYENIVINEKNITVASLYLTNPDKWFIYNTIIDGNHIGTSVTMNGGTGTMIIDGFSIRNGTGDGGGGILTNQAMVSIKNCIIEHNYANAGGGIYCNQSTVLFSGTLVKYNHGKNVGGGISCGYNSQMQFDTINKCNIYLNYSGKGTDIAKSFLAPAQLIIVDTFTVLYPDYHFIFSWDVYNFPVNDINIQISNGYLTPVNQDLYINPLSGNDNNSGISPEESLKTISFAYLLIKSDSLNPHSIYLANGIYSSSTNDEKLPLASRSYISLVGENRDSTIIDADSLSSFFTGYGLMKNYKIENITFQHGIGGVYIEKNDFISIKNVVLKNGGFSNFTGFDLYYIDSLLFKDTRIVNLKGSNVLSISNWAETIKSFIVEDCIIDNNLPDDDPIQTGWEGGGLGIIGDSDPPFSYYGTITNLQVTHNLRIPDPFWGPGMGVGLIVNQHCKINLINSTIGNNVLRGEYGYAAKVLDGAELNMYNSIFYGDSLRELALGSLQSDDPSELTISHSDIKGGIWNVTIFDDSELNWLEGNIDNDPLWDTTAAIPYAIPWNSPCVNTGTPMYEAGMQPPYIIEEETVYKLITFDYDTIDLPQTDLAGNPRIFGGRIDMGAYECQDTGTGVAKYKYQTVKLEVEVYPNPFCYNTFIMFEMENKAEVRVIIYDLQGNAVKELMNASLPAGNYNLTWGGEDEGGNKAENGTYLVSVFVDGDIAASEKILKKK